MDPGVCTEDGYFDYSVALCCEGFSSQYNSQWRLLRDSGAWNSPRHLEPLHKQRFIQDFRRRQYNAQHSPPGYFPYERARAPTRFSEVALASKFPSLGPRPAEDGLVTMHMDHVPQHYPGQYGHRTYLPQGDPRRSSCHPAPEGCLPEVTPCCGQSRRRLRGAMPGSRTLINTGDVTVPEVPATSYVEQDNWYPKLDIPNMIQQKVIPGYTGFIPRFTWIDGMSYIPGVRKAIKEFDRQQFLSRNPPHGFGKRLPHNYWPNNRIYTSVGHKPFYTGFIPHHRHHIGLTYGNSTRVSYLKEQQRRAFAL